MEFKKPIIKHQIKGRTIIRKGRGYSLLELAQAGLDLKEARKIRIPVDRLRSTVHEKNVEQLTGILNNTKQNT